VILVGRVGKDPETRHMEGGTQVSSFSMATSESYKDKSGQKQEKTEWHNIVLWRGLSEVVEKYVKKGDMLYIEGKLTTRKWQDKEGNDRYTTEIVASEMKMLSGKSEGQPKAAVAAGNDEPDDLPF
jgi:single-strand DNA-binding protein